MTKSKYKYFPKRLPQLIFGLILFYLFITAFLGYIFYSGNTSPKLLNLTRFFPVPVIKVDGQLIWARKFIEYRNFMENFIARSSQAGEAINLDKSLNQQVVEILVQNFLIERIAKDFNIKISQEEVDASYKNLLVVENGEGPKENITEAELETILEELYGSDSKKLKEFIEIRLLENKIKQEIIKQVKFRYILVATQKEAEDIIKKLKSKGNFASLAKEFSKDQLTRDKGGEVNFVSQAELETDKGLQVAVFGNPVGLIQSPVKTSNGFSVVEILEQRGQVSGSFADFINVKKAELGVRIFIDLD